MKIHVLAIHAAKSDNGRQFLQMKRIPSRVKQLCKRDSPQGTLLCFEFQTRLSFPLYTLFFSLYTPKLIGRLTRKEKFFSTRLGVGGGTCE